MEAWGLASAIVGVLQWIQLLGMWKLARDMEFIFWVRVWL